MDGWGADDLGGRVEGWKVRWKVAWMLDYWLGGRVNWQLARWKDRRGIGGKILEFSGG